MGNSLKYLKELSEAHGVTGYEDDVRSLIISYLEEWGVKHRTDFLGNLIVEFSGNNEKESPRVLLDAHMDEIGLVVSYVEPSGYLRFTTVGGWDERILPAQKVCIKTSSGKIVEGIIGTPPPHILSGEERTRPFSLFSLFIDIGATNQDEVLAAGVSVGDSAVIGGEFRKLNDKVVTGKALDNRVGCAILLSLVEDIANGTLEPAGQVYALFSTFEEVGGRGAKVATTGMAPDIALVLEGTVAGDTPGTSGAICPSYQGRGPAITLIDRSTHVPQRFVKFLAKVAGDNSIPHQLKTPIWGGTNAAVIQTAGEGVLTGIISAPCRYIHGPWSVLREEDFLNTEKLARAFLVNVDKLLKD